MFASYQKGHLVFAALVLCAGWAIRNANRQTPEWWWANVPKFSFLNKVNVEDFKFEYKDVSGFFYSAEEVSRPLPGVSTGKIPAWVTGSLVKNGPGLFEFGNGKEVRSEINKHGLSAHIMLNFYSLLRVQEVAAQVQQLHFTHTTVMLTLGYQYETWCVASHMLKIKCQMKFQLIWTCSF